MQLYRLASEFVFIETDNITKVINDLSSVFSGTSISYRDAIYRGGEGSSIILFRENKSCNKPVCDDENVLLIETPAIHVVSSLFQLSCRNDILAVHCGPYFVILRYFEHGDQVLDTLLSRISTSERVTWDDGIERGREDNRTLIALTDKPLRGSLSREDFYPEMALIKNALIPILRQLRQESLSIISSALDEKEWHELKIVIYDSKNEIMPHYERLARTLTDLQAGMILSESWTRDHPFIMVTVLAYEITLLTLQPPHEIKKILLGLEYDQSGTRLVDFDLYAGKKKISWTDKHIRKIGSSRDEIGVKLHKELAQRLSSM